MSRLRKSELKLSGIQVEFYYGEITCPYCKKEICVELQGDEDEKIKCDYCEKTFIAEVALKDYIG